MRGTGVALRRPRMTLGEGESVSPGRAEDKPLLGEVRAGDRVLVVSASMGAGHDGAAKELRRRMEARGVEVDVVDYLAYLPAGTGWFVRWFYGKQLSVAPKSYQVLYTTIERFAFAQKVCAFYTSTAKRPLSKQIAKHPYQLIVSTYPLASQTLGQLRHQGVLATPLATVLTDFSVHTLWVNKHIDLHMALHTETAALAKELGAPRVEVVEPLVVGQVPRAAARPARARTQEARRPRRQPAGTDRRRLLGRRRRRRHGHRAGRRARHHPGGRLRAQRGAQAPADRHAQLHRARLGRLDAGAGRLERRPGPERRRNDLPRGFRQRRPRGQPQLHPRSRHGQLRGARRRGCRLPRAARCPPCRWPSSS